MSTSMGGYSGFKGPTGKAQGLKGTGYQQTTLKNFTPEQQQLFQHLLGQVGPNSQTSRLAAGDQSQFDQLEAPAMRQFGALQGNLASRFSGQGMGGRRSSSFQNAQTSAASNFAQDLQSQRMGLQRQAIQDLMGMGNSLLNQRPYENVLLQKEKPYWQQLGIAGAGGLGQLATGAGNLGIAKWMGLF